MSDTCYEVDLASIRRAFPPGLEPPPLLVDFAGWLAGRPWGGVGCFDLRGSFADEAPIVDGAPLRREFALFLRLPDGSRAGFWYPPGLDAARAPVIALGSEGEAEVLADSLEGLLAGLARRGFDDGGTWSDLAPHEEAPDLTPELEAWLRSRLALAGLEPLLTPAPDRPDFEARMAAWTEQREAYWAEHPAMAELAKRLSAHAPGGGDPWAATTFEAAIVGDLCEVLVLRRGRQPVPEADAVAPVLRALRGEQARADPDLGLWYQMSFTLTAGGRILPHFDYGTRPTIAGAPAPVAQARADLARYPRPERWIPAWLDDEPRP